MKTKHLLVVITTVLLVSSSCNTKYTTDFVLPNKNPKYSDVYPETINELKMKVEAIKSDTEGVEGFSAIYGKDNIIISAYQTPSKKAADSFFKDEIVPVFDDMSSHSRGNINGKWYASGKQGNKKAYAWVNSNWIFVITADSEENFNAAIDAFKFIVLK